jgi:hypothetical protein
MQKYLLPVLFAFPFVQVPEIAASIVYSGLHNHVMVHAGTIDFPVPFGGFGDTIRFRTGRQDIFMVSASSQQRFATVYQQIGTFYPVLAFDEASEVTPDFTWNLLGGGAILDHNPESDRFGLGGFFDQQNKYIAIRALDGDDAFYGWIRVSHNMAEQQFIVHDWAWNTVAGAPIMAGQIPEPRTVALWIGLAAAGFALGRRKRFRGGPAR